MRRQPSLRAVKKACRELADELVREQYSLYDAIWTDRIRIDSSLLDHGKDSIAELNLRMPNLLVHHATACPLDETAANYGFADSVSLMDFLLAYKPRGPVRERLYAQLLAEQLAEQLADPEPQPSAISEIAEVPF